MMPPDFCILPGDFARNGFLTTRSLAVVSSKLLNQGVILYPGDRSYCVGSYAHSGEVRSMLSRLTNSNKDRVSIAFASYGAAKELIVRSREADLLMEEFSPGPLILFCKPQSSVAKKAFFAGPGDGQPAYPLGIRVSGSMVERDLAASSPHYLFASSELLTEEGEYVTDFEAALDQVALRTGSLESEDGIGWGAIKATDSFDERDPTIALLNGVELDIVQAGIVSESMLSASLKSAPLSDYEDWG